MKPSIDLQKYYSMQTKSKQPVILKYAIYHIKVSYIKPILKTFITRFVITNPNSIIQRDILLENLVF